MSQRLLGSHGKRCSTWGTDSAADPEFSRSSAPSSRNGRRRTTTGRGRSLADALPADTVKAKSRRNAGHRGDAAGAARRGQPARSDAARPRVGFAWRPPCLTSAIVEPPSCAAPAAPRCCTWPRSRPWHAGRTRGDLPGRQRQPRRHAAAAVGALRALRAHIAPDVHLFSTTWRPSRSTASARATSRRRAGPTSLASSRTCRQHRPRRRVITDGYGRRRRRPWSRRPPACRDIRVLLTPGGTGVAVDGYASRVEQLPSLKCG